LELKLAVSGASGGLGATVGATAGLLVVARGLGVSGTVGGSGARVAGRVVGVADGVLEVDADGLGDALVFSGSALGNGAPSNSESVVPVGAAVLVTAGSATAG